MITVLKHVLINWSAEKNQRIKLQQAYFTLVILLAVIAGLVTLLNAYAGMNLIITAAFLAAVYLTNAVCWTVIDLIVSKKINDTFKRTTVKKR